MGWVKREWARMANERGKIRVRVMREKVRGERRGIEIEAAMRAGRVRSWRSSAGMSMKEG